MSFRDKSKRRNSFRRWQGSLARNTKYAWRLIEPDWMSWRGRRSHLSKNRQKESHLRRRLKMRRGRDFQQFKA